MAQQRVWAPDGSDTRGLSLFANFVQADRNITAKDQMAEIGLFWTGPFSFRPQDDLSVAIGRIHVNSRIAEGEVLYNAELAPLYGLSPKPVQHAEYPMEVYYGVNITPAVTLRPNVQFIHAPGESTRAPMWSYWVCICPSRSNATCLRGCNRRPPGGARLERMAAT
jgi:porin